MVFSMIKLQK